MPSALGLSLSYPLSACCAPSHGWDTELPGMACFQRTEHTRDGELLRPRAQGGGWSMFGSLSRSYLDQGAGWRSAAVLGRP